MYGALGRLIQVLSEKLSLDRTRRRTTNEEPAFIAEELMRTDPISEKDKYDALIEILRRRGKPSTVIPRGEDEVVDDEELVEIEEIGEPDEPHEP